jgi:hypothetical protein
MPLTVNVGLNRKASRDFQSAGVSINLAAELEMGLLSDPHRLQHEIEKVYAQAEAALDRQVHAMTVTVTSPSPAELTSASHTSGNPKANPDGERRHEALSPRRDPLRPEPARTGSTEPMSHRAHPNGSGSFGGAVRPATESQIRALRAICKRARRDLDQEAHEEFGIGSADLLDVRQASQLIDLLKARQKPEFEGPGRFPR